MKKFKQRMTMRKPPNMGPLKQSPKPRKAITGPNIRNYNSNNCRRQKRKQEEKRSYCEINSTTSAAQRGEKSNFL